MGIQGRYPSVIKASCKTDRVNKERALSRLVMSAKLVKKIKWLACASALTASASAMAAPALVQNNITPNTTFNPNNGTPTANLPNGNMPTSVGSGQGERAIWPNAGTVNGVAVDIVGVVTTATLNHYWITLGLRPAIFSAGQDNIQIEWRLYQAGTYNISTDTGGVPVVADVHVQFNDIDGANNERVFLPVCTGAIKWVRIDTNATTTRTFGTVAGQTEILSIIGDKTYANSPDSGVEVLYPDASVFRMGRTANLNFIISLNSPTYLAANTLDYECADFQPPVAANDSGQGLLSAPTVINILNNDSFSTENNNAPNNNLLLPSEYAKSSVSLVVPVGATGVTTDAKGDKTGFTVAGQGTWAYNDTTGALTFTPVANFYGTVTPITYTVDNAMGILSNAATVSITPVAFADLSLAKTVSNAAPFTGGAFSYELKVSSAATSNATATGVTVQDNLPAGFTFTSASGTGTFDSATGVWSVGSVAPGTSATITINGTASGAAGAAVVNTAQISASSLPDPDSTVNNGIITEDDYATISFTPVLGTIVVATSDSVTGINGVAGTTSALNVFTGDTVGGAPASATNATLSLALGSMLPPELTFDTATGAVGINPGTPAGTYSFNYQICETANPLNCKVATSSVTVSPAADLVITKSNGVTGVIKGSNITYTLTATNNGPDSVTGAIVTDTPGSGITCAATNVVTVSSGGAYTVADLTGTGITLGLIPNGQAVTLSYSCTVN